MVASIVDPPGITLLAVLKACECGERRVTVRSLIGLEQIDANIRTVERADAELIKSIVLMQLHRARAVFLEGNSYYDEAVGAAEEGLRRARDGKLSTTEIPILAQIANLHRRAGRLGKAEEYLDLSLERAKVTGNAGNDALIFYERGYIAHLRGEFEEAMKWFSNSVECASKEGDFVGQLAGLASLARQHCLNGDVKSALALTKKCDSMLAISNANVDEDWVERWKVNNWCHEIEVRLLEGKLRRVSTLLKWVSLSSENMPSQRAFSRTQSYYLAQIALKARKHESAEEELTRYLNEIETTQGLRNSESAAEPIVLLARCLVGQNKIEEAKDRFEFALQLPADLGNRRGQAWACIDLATNALRNHNLNLAGLMIERAIALTKRHYSPERMRAMELRKLLAKSRLRAT